ncbi:MAG: hypothetical protein J1G38_00075 [Clostridiales bacterium]|nr:hypothetical protein [Clostridiales bacterium]
MDSRILGLINGYHEIHKYLIENGQVSFANDVDSYYKKILVFSCASLFENLICNSIYEKAKIVCPAPIAEFIRNKAIERQYHTYFQWKEPKTSSINVFLGLWGDDFKTSFLNVIKNDEKLSDGVKAFLILGNERNLMAHENFIEYNPISTFNEIKVLYEQADYFVNTLLSKIEAIE